MTDGGLPKLISSHIPQAHFQRIESGGVGRGTPDLNGCLEGQEIWVECKHTPGWVVSSFKERPQQVGWLERRSRAGGRCFIAVRQTGKGRDSLWLLRPEAGRLLLDGSRLDAIHPLVLGGLWTGGPSRWPWEEVREVLFGRQK